MEDRPQEDVQPFPEPGQHLLTFQAVNLGRDDGVVEEAHGGRQQGARNWGHVEDDRGAELLSEVEAHLVEERGHEGDVIVGVSVQQGL